MELLTVKHAYGPTSGFIVARETTEPPRLLSDAPPLDAANEQAWASRIAIAFVTADRCAPCRRCTRDALKDAGVIASPSSRGS